MLKRISIMFNIIFKKFKMRKLKNHYKMNNNKTMKI